MPDSQSIPSVPTILWACFAALIVTGATSAPAILLSADMKVGVVTGIVSFCSTIAVMLGIGGKIPSNIPAVVTTTETVVKTTEKPLDLPKQ